VTHDRGPGPEIAPGSERRIVRFCMTTRFHNGPRGYQFPSPVGGFLQFTHCTARQLTQNHGKLLICLIIHSNNMRRNSAVLCNDFEKKEGCLCQ